MSKSIRSLGIFNSLNEISTPKHITTAVREIEQVLVSQGYADPAYNLAMCTYAADLLKPSPLASSSNERLTAKIENIGSGSGFLNRTAGYAIDFISVKEGPQPPQYLVVGYDGQSAKAASFAAVHAGLKARQSIISILGQSASASTSESVPT